MVGRYDKYLIAMAAAVAIGGLASAHPAIAVYEGLGAGSLFATVILYEVLFRNPPTEPVPSRTAHCAFVAAAWFVTLLTYL
jgi:hypothetical protein